MRTKCCRTVTERFTSVVLHSFFPQVFRRLVLLRGTPCASGRTSTLSPACVGYQASTSVSPGLIGCNRLIRLHIHIYIHVLVFLFPIFCSTRVFCVAGSLSYVCFFVHTSMSVSLSLPFLTYSSVEDPGGPASFSMHARSKVTYLVNPTSKGRQRSRR